ncbi:protein KASH5 isoform X3 [Cavia porcellus]|uniref:protein KASH5 isoform X3 n=1 Tax=Cavia porcellus TaxID=10141 RepID=UPI002FE3D563
MDQPDSQAGGPAAEVYLWEQPEDMSLGPLLSLEEQILNSTFEACDPQRTGGRGTVAVTRVLAYLEAVTGQGPQDARLQTLTQSLDPNGEGPAATVDLNTFLVVMRNWIAACQLHGGLELGEETASEGALTSPQLPSGCPEAEEPANLESFGGEDPRPELSATADLLSTLEDLELSNRRLAGENAKLQRSVETAEEGSARLGEEILALRRQLRSTQQALQSAKAVGEELEDLKTLAKSLEEQNRCLLAQARQTKEQQHLVAEVETLQEENGKLLAEREEVKRRSEELATEKDALKRQLYECERLICQRDTILSERARHTESLTKTVEEYRATTRELRREISHLEEQLCQAQEAPDELLEDAQARGVGWTMPLPPSLGLEIEASWQKQEVAGANLCNPLCGVWHWGETSQEEPEAPSEVPDRGQRNSEEEPEPECPAGVGKELSPGLHGREEEAEAEAVEEAKQLLRADPPILLSDLQPGDIAGQPPESPAEPVPQQALVPVVKELVPVGRPWGQHCLSPLYPQPPRATRHLLLPPRVLGPVLLLLLLSVLLLGQAPPPTWPHLQLCYLQPPPV